MVQVEITDEDYNKIKSLMDDDIHTEGAVIAMLLSYWETDKLLSGGEIHGKQMAEKK